MNKIGDKELKGLNEVITKRKEALLSLGELEVTKHSLLHELNALDNALLDRRKKLNDVYGDVNINIETGEIKDAD
jgi:hypothetical protein